MHRHRIRALVLLLAVGCLLGLGIYVGVVRLYEPATAAAADAAAPPPPVILRYHDPAFTDLVAESYAAGGKPEVDEFFRWADQAYQSSHLQPAGMETLTLEQALDHEQQVLAAIADAGARTEVELRQGSWLHRVIKTILPKFNLERGFEFHYAVERGERQCFLQSVLIASMLQRMGIDAGVVMVFRNPGGQESNLGHAAVLEKLSDGRDILVDASDPTPFIRHLGLLVRAPRYRFVTPVYASKSGQIVSYHDLGRAVSLTADRVAPLDLAFLRSQFWYYRGERAVGGIFSAHPTREGLATSARCLVTSVKNCPNNPLATYMLGRVYLRQGQRAKAHQTLLRAQELYARFGWKPEGLHKALAEVAPRRRAK